MKARVWELQARTEWSIFSASSFALRNVPRRIAPLSCEIQMLPMPITPSRSVVSKITTQVEAKLDES